MVLTNNHSEDFFDYVESLHDGDIHLAYDSESQLRAIIVIDSTVCGPALGGCRCIQYTHSLAALTDAVRLARGMTRKAAIMDLPLGGGKTVLMAPAKIPDRKAYFQAFGRFVDQLGGRYITAMDSGTTLEDMDVIASQTPYVANVSTLTEFPTGDPSPFTAAGVFRGIQAAIQYKWSKTSCADLHVAIQGVGHVGYPLAKLLHEQGARITVSDVHEAHVQRCVDTLGASVCKPEETHRIECDIYAPCALGAILNDTTIPDIKAPIVAGAANNQLARIKDGEYLHEREILYVPDYVINAGGLIYAYEQFSRTNEDKARENIDRIYDIIMAILTRSEKENKPTSEVADEIAMEKVKACQEKHQI